MIHTNNTPQKIIDLDIYYNPKEKYPEKSKHHKDINLPDYQQNFINYTKEYPQRLYKKEYTRPGEREFISDFCHNSIINVDDLPDFDKKSNFRFITFNVHSFIETCKVYNNVNSYLTDINTNINSRSNENVYKFINKLKPDILFIQEYSPVYVKNSDNLTLSGFVDEYNSTFTNNQLPYFVTSNCNDTSSTYLGNMIMANTQLTNGNITKYEVPSQDSRCFIKSVTNINGFPVHLCNIHPVSMGVSNLNKSQIDNYFSLIETKYKLNIETDPIIIAGDFNTSDYIPINSNFISIKNIYGENVGFTGYHASYIDEIFVSVGFLKKFKINNYNLINVGLSDHYPLFFDFVLKDNIYNDTISTNIIRQQFSFNKVFNNLSVPQITNYITNIYIDLKQFLVNTIYNDITIIPEGTFLIHGTNSISFKGDNIPFELSTDDYGLIAKSFTLLHNPGESFMSWYGADDPISLKRFLVYKTTRAFPVLNLYKAKDSIEKKLNYRLEFYNLLFGHIFKTYTNIVNNNITPFEKMFVLQAVLNNILLNHINDDKINNELFYGFLMADYITNDVTQFKVNHNHNKTLKDYGHNEVYEGLELQLCVTSYLTELVGVYYNNTFFSISEWKTASKPYIQKILENKKNPNYTPINLREGKINDAQKYYIIANNIISYYKYIKNVLKHSIYSSSNSIQNSELIIKNALNINNKLLKIKKYFVHYYLLNDYLLNLLNIKFSYPVNTPLQKSVLDFDNLRILENNIYDENILDNLKKYFKNKLLKEDGTDTFVNSILFSAVCYFRSSVLIDPPILVLMKLADTLNNNGIHNNDIQSNLQNCMFDSRFLINKYDSRIHISAPLFVSNNINNSSFIKYMAIPNNSPAKFSSSGKNN